uniref:Putative splicing factor 3b subunit 5 n=1 Tax=Triatoma dimidiata TaxID=72491 RepID=A0A0V0G8V7_TRIDM
MIDSQYIDKVTKEIKKYEKKTQVPLDSYQRVCKDKKTYKEAFSEIIKFNNVRSDGRKLDEHRKMFIKLGVSADCRGSCYIELGETKVIVGVHGPKEIPNIQEYTELGKLECIIEYAPFASLTRKRSTPEQSDKYMSAAMRRALEPVFCRHEFPNLMIQVSAFVIEDDGCVLSAAITGASLAIAHGRLPLFDFAAAVSISLHNDLIFIDPTKAEEEFCLNTVSAYEKKVENYGVISVAYMPHLDQMSHYQMIGNMDPKLYESTLDIMLNHCRALYSLCSKHLMQEVKLTTKHLLQVKETQDALNSLSVT